MVLGGMFKSLLWLGSSMGKDLSKSQLLSLNYYTGDLVVKLKHGSLEEGDKYEISRASLGCNQTVSCSGY